MEVLQYVQQRGPATGPSSCSGTSPQSQKQHLWQMALSTIGQDLWDYPGHGFRIGEATTATLVGQEDSVICSLGRWNSNAFLHYVWMQFKFTCVPTCTIKGPLAGLLLLPVLVISQLPATCAIFYVHSFQHTCRWSSYLLVSQLISNLL